MGTAGAYRLLLVEDSPADADLVRDLLEESGEPAFEFTRVERLAAALRSLQQEAFDAVLLDLGLPDSQGLATLRRFQEETGPLAVIVLTGQEDAELGTRAIQLGAQDFLPKAELTPALIGRTLRYAIERQRSASELRLMAAAFESGQAILITDVEGRIQRVNDAFTRITGYSEGEVVGRNPSILQSGQHDRAFYERLWGELRVHDHWEGEIWNRRRNGNIYPEWESITAVRNEWGQVEHYVAVFHDISEQKRLEAELEREASTDRLTGACNRLRFDTELESALARFHRYGTETALIMFDMDHFKWFNDTRGHDAGDRVLREVTERVANAIREPDTLARWGGEEFTLILPETDAEGARDLAERLRRAVGDEPVADAGHVTISLGVTRMGAGDDADSLLKRLDNALYRAKELGRNTVCYLEPEAELKHRAS
jgi:diguanylate cyclase (GGDEF)-like protein/PAS domain S-box-containing protein